MDDINRLKSEDDSLDTTPIGQPLESGPAEPDATGTGFGERLDGELDETGFDDTAGETGTGDESLIDKAKDKYREIMSDDK